MPDDRPPVDVAQEPYRSYIGRALVYAGGTHTVDDVLEMIAAGTAQAWPGPRSIIVTELVEYPRCRRLHVFLAGGNRTELEAMTPLVLQWGREQGCQSATLCGRRGWARTFLVRQGWTVADRILMEHPLSPTP